MKKLHISEGDSLIKTFTLKEMGMDYTVDTLPSDTEWVFGLKYTSAEGFYSVGDIAYADGVLTVNLEVAISVGYVGDYPYGIRATSITDGYGYSAISEIKIDDSFLVSGTQVPINNAYIDLDTLLARMTAFELELATHTTDIATNASDILTKVDKVTGKALSTNDFTDLLKTKVDDSVNYDDAAVKLLITNKTHDTLVDKNSNPLFQHSTQTEKDNTATKSVELAKTLLAATWASGEYVLAVAGVTATSNQELLPTTDITAGQLSVLQSANIIGTAQATDSITIKAMGLVPTVDLPIRVIVRGD